MIDIVSGPGGTLLLIEGFLIRSKLDCQGIYTKTGTTFSCLLCY